MRFCDKGKRIKLSPDKQRRKKDPMSTLDLKVPPLVVAAIAAIAMWLVTFVSPVMVLAPAVRVGLVLVSVIVGVGISLTGIITFRRTKTTVNPHTPEKASSLVTVGIYQFTRNPMYVGVLCVLLGWAIFLSAPLALVGPLAFYLYIGRFQITPEEKALHLLFGSEYSMYKQRVRRWL